MTIALPATMMSLRRGFMPGIRRRSAGVSARISRWSVRKRANFNT